MRLQRRLEQNCRRCLMKSRFTGSIIIWEKKPFRILWRCGSLMSFLNLNGIMPRLTMFRSLLLKRLEWARGLLIMMTVGQSGIWCRIIFCSWSAWWQWSRLPILMQTRCVMKNCECCARCVLLSWVMSCGDSIRIMRLSWANPPIQKPMLP